MNEENVPKPYSLLDQARALFNQPELADVFFVVGENKERICAHRIVLAVGSPAFKQMFYGGLKEENDVIEIPDLTAAGFKNALRYLYGSKLDFEPSELLETYMVGNKYLFLNWQDAISEHLNERLDAKNCLPVYDHLFGANNDELSSLVKNFIADHAAEVFRSAAFVELSQDALVDLLKSGKLHLTEIDLLRSVSNWVSAVVQKQGLPVTVGNRQRAFEPIKPFVKFADLDANEVADFDEIHSLLTGVEVASLFVHLLNREKPLKIDCRTSRPKGNVGNAGDSEIDIYSICNTRVTVRDFNMSTFLNVNLALCITRIYTTVTTNDCADLRLTVFEPKFSFEWESEGFVQDKKWCFKMKGHLYPANSFTLKFVDSRLGMPVVSNFSGDSSTISLEKSGKTYICRIKPLSPGNAHFVERITFSLPD